MKQEQYITLDEALRQMRQINEQGALIPFSFEYVSYDKQKNDGGEIVQLNGCVLSKLARDKKYRSQKLYRERKESAWHWSNDTAAVLILSSGEIRRFHISLITKFNNKIVVWGK